LYVGQGTVLGTRVLASNQRTMLLILYLEPGYCTRVIIDARELYWKPEYCAQGKGTAGGGVLDWRLVYFIEARILYWRTVTVLEVRVLYWKPLGTVYCRLRYNYY
jgi:hypothetical protein